jgi:hypothetical protein
LREGDFLLLENLRFHPEEEKNDETFSKALASLCDVYVNDAFGALPFILGTLVTWILVGPFSQLLAGFRAWNVRTRKPAANCNMTDTQFSAS